MATLTEVARAARVSVATASRVLNPGRHPVRHETAARVRAAAAELGFRPNLLARGLRSRWVRTVGVLIHDMTDPYFAEVARGIADEAWESGFLTITCNTDRVSDEELRYAALLCESRVAGVLFVGGGLDDEAYRERLRPLVDEIRGYGGHVLALGPRTDEWPAEVPDNHGGARLAVEHLLALGHRAIALVGGPPALHTTHEREAGYREALHAAGVAVNPRLIVSGSFTVEGGARAMSALLESGQEFSAVLVTTDAMAIGGLRALGQRGISVPRDLSLVGVDNIPVSDYLNPPLTTVDLHMRELGAAGVQRLQRLLSDVDGGPRVQVHPTHLIVRGSTAPPAGR